VVVIARGSSAPPVPGECKVVRLAALLKLMVRGGTFFRPVSGREVGNCWLAFRPSIMEDIMPGPSDFRAGRDSAAVGGGGAPDC
jgi:hypothetical protein